jgi:hypothetical protein
MSEDKINIKVNPEKTPILTVDGYIIGSNNANVVLNFAQSVLGTNQQHVVARVSLTHLQAKEFLSKLNEHLEKHEI